MKFIVGLAAVATVLTVSQAAAQSADEKASCMVPIPGTDAVSVSIEPECKKFRSEPDDPKFKEPDCRYKRYRAMSLSLPSEATESVAFGPCFRVPD